MSNLVQNKRMHIMNIFPFVGVRYIMYYHGKHGGWLVTLRIRRNVIHVLAKRANIGAAFTVFSSTTFSRHAVEALLCEWYPTEKIALRDDRLESSIQKKKKKHLSPSRTRFWKKRKKNPVVIQLVQVQLRAFQLQIRAELRIRIDNQARSLPKTRALR